ncbi:hypothetical protein [Noviherbaspirillum saxi]|uniref:Uncharacterized protein n=1 Tax=Noviherbaspirillum saxi TaxID=2320863 RepID=A0A3A3FG40_9BURK|nr:hypothetical protein [Noviherbaspirillum saxi]RJF92346.1 hypothetical protein D3871_27370 [Noviherbaspirillum saxi]
MKSSIESLCPYEFEALLNALRRDMRLQADLAKVDVEWANWHGNNARVSQRILEALNPKTINPDDVVDDAAWRTDFEISLGRTGESTHVR